MIELVGTSSESWEKAATVAVERASQTLRDLRVELVEQDLVIEEGKVRGYRTRWGSPSSTMAEPGARSAPLPPDQAR